MSDVSGNENFEDETIENESFENEDVSSNGSGDTENENYQSEIVYTDSSDYVPYFENLSNIGLFISSLIFALILLVGFVGGFNNGKH